MKSIMETFNNKSLNIQKPFINFFGLNEAIVLTLMIEKFIYSTEQNRTFKLPKSEYSPFVKYHSFMKATEYFQSLGLLLVKEDVNGIQAGKDYILNQVRKNL